MPTTSLKVGDKVPEFSLKDQHGNLFSLADHIGKKNMVIYFYPKDDTPGCTAEACAFRDAYEDFLEAGVLVIGISSDDVATHKRFAEKYQLPFILLADTDKQVRRQFGASTFFGLLPGRITFIVDKSGKIVHQFNSMFNAKKHIAEAKKALQNSAQ